MGATLPKPVESTLVERHAEKNFQTAVAEMNGWRTNMEDSHLIFMREDYGIFGVFDGHGGDACSEFVAKRLQQEFEGSPCPEDDAAVKKLFLDIDKEFLDTEQPSGSTATMCIVRKPEEAGGKHRLHVINAGDSRVLLGRRDGTIVDGGGTDEGLTVDHKPDLPSERARIERCGGRVEHNEGNVARVNGNLAVSRGFGDKGEKQTGGPGPEDRPVTADPEMFHFECDSTDFLLLVCDGVSEGSFSNAQVVEFVADMLTEGQNPGAAAKSVCHKALAMNSKDNITCMVVLLSGAAIPTKKTVEFTPGPITNLGHKGFRTAYAAMADKAGLTLAEAAAQRYEWLQAHFATPRIRTQEFEETQLIGTPAGATGSEERLQWWWNWINGLPKETESGPGGLDMDSISGMLGNGGGKGGAKGKVGSSGTGEMVVEREEAGYTWIQKGEEVQITFRLPRPAAKKDVNVAFKPSALSVTVHGDSLLDGSLGGKVDTDDCTWCLANGGAELQVMLTKNSSKDTWKDLMK